MCSGFQLSGSVCIEVVVRLYVYAIEFFEQNSNQKFNIVGSLCNATCKAMFCGLFGERQPVLVRMHMSSCSGKTRKDFLCWCTINTQSCCACSLLSQFVGYLYLVPYFLPNNCSWNTIHLYAAFGSHIHGVWRKFTMQISSPMEAVNVFARLS